MVEEQRRKPNEDIPYESPNISRTKVPQRRPRSRGHAEDEEGRLRASPELPRFVVRGKMKMRLRFLDLLLDLLQHAPKEHPLCPSRGEVLLLHPVLLVLPPIVIGKTSQRLRQHRLVLGLPVASLLRGVGGGALRGRCSSRWRCGGGGLGGGRGCRWERRRGRLEEGFESRGEGG